jgi:protein-disulfide isomerase
LDGKAFDACLESGRNADRVKQDLYEATRIGVNGTPTLLINGRPFIGARSYEEIAAAIDEELKTKFPAAAAKP